LGNSVQMYMSGDNRIVAINNTDKRLVHIIMADADCVEQSPLTGAFDTFLYNIASHFCPL
jgi:hypothetical protein